MEDVMIKIKRDKFLKKFFPDKDLVSVYDLIGLIEDLSFEVEHLKEEIEVLNIDIEENYKPISKYDEYGIDESDFH